MLQRIQSLLQQQSVTWTLDACAGDGRLRLRPFLDLADPGDRAKLEPLAVAVYDIVLEAGGSIGGSQACGLARTQFIRKQYGDLAQAFREIKDAFDPLGQLNPGKVIGDDPHLMLRNLKPWPAPLTRAALEHPTPLPAGSGEIHVEPAPAAQDVTPVFSTFEASDQITRPPEEVIQPALRWPGLSVVETAANCQGCGTCRSLEPDRADVPELPRPAARGGLAALAGQPRPRDRHRPA